MVPPHSQTLSPSQAVPGGKVHLPELHLHFSCIVFGKHLIGKPNASPGLNVGPVNINPVVEAFVLHACINIRESLAKTLVIIHSSVCGH